MKTYITAIQYAQKISLGVSILIMLVLPPIIVFYPQLIAGEITQVLYDIAHFVLFFVMIVRPLADIFTGTNKIRPLVPLRKGFGVLSASIIVSFIFAKIIMNPYGYFAAYGTLKYWSLSNYALLAHLADVSAVILLITSNNLSKRILGPLWKKIQKLSYLYFYGSGAYVFFALGDVKLLVLIFIVTALTLWAYIENKKRREEQQRVAAQNIAPQTTSTI